MPKIEEEKIYIDSRMEKFLNMTEEEKDDLTCDEVFCLYLTDVAKQVNPTYYKTVLRFIMLYRDCLNDCGWQKRREQYEKCGIPMEEDTLYMKVKNQESHGD